MTRRNAIDVWNSDTGLVIRWRCNCGHEGTLTRDGSVPDDHNAQCPQPEHSAA